MFCELLTPLELGERVVERQQQIGKILEIRQIPNDELTQICPYNDIVLPDFGQVKIILCEFSRIAAETLETQYFISINFKQVAVP